MRVKARWRAAPGKDRVKEASRRLRTVLKTSRRLGVAAEDLEGLGAAARLRAACRGQEPSSLLFFSVLVAGILLAAGLLGLLCGGLPDLLTCANTTSQETQTQIQTMRLDRRSLDTSSEQAEDATLFNDSEDAEDGHLWQPPSLRLRRQR